MRFSAWRRFPRGFPAAGARASGGRPSGSKRWPAHIFHPPSRTPPVPKWCNDAISHERRSRRAPEKYAPATFSAPPTPRTTTSGAPQRGHPRADPMAWCCWSPATAREIIPRRPGGAPGPRQRELPTGHPAGTATTPRDSPAERLVEAGPAPRSPGNPRARHLTREHVPLAYVLAG